MLAPKTLRYQGQLYVMASWETGLTPQQIEGIKSLKPVSISADPKEGAILVWLRSERECERAADHFDLHKYEFNEVEVRLSCAATNWEPTHLALYPRT